MSVVSIAKDQPKSLGGSSDPPRYNRNYLRQRVEDSTAREYTGSSWLQDHKLVHYWFSPPEWEPKR